MSGDRADALIDERELAAALRDLRPEPAAFRAAVERRLQEAADESARPGGSDEGELAAADGGWWRRAAAWLPVELAPASLAGAGGNLTWKALTGLIALPALTFAMLVMPLYLALGTLASRTGERAEERLAVVRGWWREHRSAALATLALVGLLFLRWPAGAGVALLLVSTGVLALLLARLRAAGFGRRSEVARHCGGLLLALVMLMGLFGSPWRALFESERAAKLGIFVLAFGGLVCTWLLLRERHRGLWQVLTRSSGEDAAFLLAIAWLVPVSGMGLEGALRARLDPGSLARDVSELRPEDREGWEYARDVVAWARGSSLEPELGGLRAHWLARREFAGGAEAGFEAAGIELGFIAAEELGALAHEARGLLHEEGPLPGASLREHGGLFALVCAGTLSEQERAHLARRLYASRDAGAQPWVLERLATVAALLDRLGERELADGLRPEAQALVLESWVPPGRFSGHARAGFFPRRWQERDQAWAPCTHAALDLMLRFGVPEGIDLPAVARGLERARRGLESTLAAEAGLALSKLEHGLLPERGPLGWLGANAVLLAMVLLSGACVAATLRAPSERLA